MRLRPSNAALHSFATFRLLAFRHTGETSIQLGHGDSPELLHRHYKGIASEAGAGAFWEIRPVGSLANVIARRASRGSKSGSRAAEESAGRHRLRRPRMRCSRDPALHLVLGLGQNSPRHPNIWYDLRWVVQIWGFLHI